MVNLISSCCFSPFLTDKVTEDRSNAIENLLSNGYFKARSECDEEHLTFPFDWESIHF